MPDMLTPQALATAGPLVLETFFKHYLAPKLARNASEARGDLMYDEAFVLMKTFLEIATKHPVAALQRFGLVRTPAPPWVALHRVLIPQSTLSSAAEFLVTAMGGPEMAYKIAGGSKWWQVRAGSGVEGEWIVMKKDWKEANGGKGRRGSRTPDKKSKSKDQSPADPEEGLVGDDGGVGENGEFRKEMDEMRCMLYSESCPETRKGYYWGSINTHRYTIWRYARKMHGRCFAVNYRKAPQYPFPCAIQDCLAAYLYLVDPPPDAKHKPVDPKNIVLAGDSAGGGLVWALLQILRDTEGLELPAGAVLISPWSDLTHSFPSILSNTATDIVPPYGFIHKPSSLWPPPPPALTEEIQNNLRTRVRDAVSRLRGEHHMPRRSSVGKSHLPESPVIKESSSPTDMRSSSPGAGAPGDAKEGKQSLHPISERHDEQHHPGPTGESSVPPHRANPADAFGSLKNRSDHNVDTRKTTLTLCDTPMKLEVKDKSVLIDTQIQLYATNAQLCHPWVSPILGYLGGLPPLLIIAGDKEVLRDEILYVAHKAAHPEEYPIRDDVRAQLPSLQGIEARYGPTDVHLQVYDGACHDLPLFSMTKVARGVFRAIASFARYVTPSAPGSLAISRSQYNSPGGSGASTPAYPMSSPASEDVPVLAEPVSSTPPFMTPRSPVTELPDPKLDMSRLTVSSTSNGAAYVDSPRSMSSTSLRKRRSASKFGLSTMSVTWGEGDEGEAVAPERQGTGPSGDDAGPRFGEDPADQDSRAKPGSAGHTGIYRGDNPFKDHMIRERVATDGTCRPLESAEELCAMTMPRDEIGMIKEGPAIRYLNGQSLWEKKFKHAIKTVERHRKRNLKDAHERDVGKISKMWDERVQSRKRERGEGAGEEVVQVDRDTPGSQRHGDDDADWETEAPSEAEDAEAGAFASKHARKVEKRQKTVEEELVEGSWSWSWALDGEAPPPSAIVSRRDFAEARQLALMADRMDTAHDSPVHGLSIWVGLAAFFSNSSERNKAHGALQRVHDVQKAEKAERGTLPGLSAPGRGVIEKAEKEVVKGERKVGRVGRMLGLGRK